MTSTALDGAVRAEQWKLCFRMVIAVDVRPGPHVVTGFATQGRAIGAALCHTVLEFAMMRIGVACGTAPVFEMERQDFIGPARRAHLMTIGARHGSMSAGKNKTRAAMLGDGKCGAVEVLNGVTAFTFIEIGRGGKLAVVGIFMAIRAGREFHFVKRVFSCGQMALGAFDGDVLPLERVIGVVVLLHAEE